MPTYVNIGGLVAAGFDKSGEYLLTISHSGRGVFSTKTWSKVARDTEHQYPVAGCAIGIGPISGQSIPVVEKNYQTDQLHLVSPNGLFNLFYEYGTLEISECA
jgi:hypothetical protein